MQFPFTTRAATFIERPNRYTIVARLHDNAEEVRAHCPNPGRLGELLVPGATVHLSVAGPGGGANGRKTAYDLRFVEHPVEHQLVSLDTRLPNQLFAEGLRQGVFAPFAAYTRFEQEVSLPLQPAEADKEAGSAVRSRIDFRLYDEAGDPCWVEVKSASLVIDGCARFPDAVTARGRRHVLELAQRVAQGERAAIVFIVQRPDAHELRPQWCSDPALAQALVTAEHTGVAIYAYTCTLTLQAIWVERRIGVQLTRVDEAIMPAT